jgi:hypothetical protein
VVRGLAAATPRDIFNNYGGASRNMLAQKRNNSPYAQVRRAPGIRRRDDIYALVLVKGILSRRRTSLEKEHQKHDRARPEVDGGVIPILSLHVLPRFGIAEKNIGILVLCFFAVSRILDEQARQRQGNYSNEGLAIDLRLEL